MTNTRHCCRSYSVITIFEQGSQLIELLLKQLVALFGLGVGRYIPILRATIHEEVPDAAAYQIGFKPGSTERSGYRFYLFRNPKLHASILAAQCGSVPIRSCGETDIISAFEADVPGSSPGGSTRYTIGT